MSKLAITERVDILPSQLVNATVVSLTKDLETLVGYSIQINWSSSSLVGTFTLEASNDNVNFTAIANTSQAISGSSGTHIYNAVLFHYEYVRCRFERVSGSGTMEMKFTAREEE
jgi:hypothetical protein